MEALCVTRPWIVDHEASCPASRLNTHDSGSVWLARPSPCGSFIRSSPPVYPGAPTRTARQLWDRRKPRSGSHSSVLHTLEDQFERLSICGINTCGVDPSPLQSLETKTKTCVLSILKLYLKILICGIYLEIWAMWSDKQLGISRRWL